MSNIPSSYQLNDDLPMKPVEYVRETIDLVKQIETRFLELGARLYHIREKNLWSGTYESYSEFLDSAHITRSTATMLYAIHKTYIVEGGKKPAELAGIGYSNLYRAIPLIEERGIEKTVAAVGTLSRDEIEDELRDKKHGTHTHRVGVERWGTCTKCGKFVRVEA